MHPGGGLYLEIALKYKEKQSKTGKFPSVDKPLKNISPGAYFRNFTVCQFAGTKRFNIGKEFNQHRIYLGPMYQCGA